MSSNARWVRLLVVAALVVGGLFALSRCELVRSFGYLYEKSKWKRISLHLDNIAQLAELDVDAEYDLSISGRDLSMSDLVPLTRLRGVRALSLRSFPELGGGFLRSLASFQTLRELYLADTLLDDPTMEAIRDMPDLRSLGFNSSKAASQISNLELLLPLANVESLDLKGWRLTADHARVVGSLFSLRVLRLGIIDLADFLGGIPRGSGIRSLDLSTSCVEPHEFRILIQWASLRAVTLQSADDHEFASTTAELRRRGVIVITNT